MIRRILNWIARRLGYQPIPRAKWVIVSSPHPADDNVRIGIVALSINGDPITVEVDWIKTSMMLGGVIDRRSTICLHAQFRASASRLSPEWIPLPSTQLRITQDTPPDMDSIKRVVDSPIPPAIRYGALKGVIEDQTLTFPDRREGDPVRKGGGE